MYNCVICIIVDNMQWGGDQVFLCILGSRKIYVCCRCASACTTMYDFYGSALYVSVYSALSLVLLMRWSESREGQSGAPIILICPVARAPNHQRNSHHHDQGSTQTYTQTNTHTQRERKTHMHNLETKARCLMIDEVQRGDEETYCENSFLCISHCRLGF